MTVYCRNNACKFNSGGACKKTILVLEGPGLCSEWFGKNGQMYQVPLYDVQGKPVAASESEIRKLKEWFNKKMTEIQPSENPTENSEKHENEVKNDEKTISESTKSEGNVS